MKRIKLTVAYDGTNYCGWQVQPNEVTIEGVLNQTISNFLHEDIKVIGASRTDSGVHAFGNVAVFDTNTKIPADKLSYALNQWLPEDICIQGSEEVHQEFHPRHCNSIKTYEYHIINRTFALPTYRTTTHFIYYSLNMEAMQQASDFFVGEHDFKSFCSVKSQVESTYRRIYKLTVEKEGDLIIIRVSGNGFLYNMVRIIAGTLIEIGIGKYLPEQVKKILDAKERTMAGPTAPAKGLTLMGIKYEKDTSI